MTRRELTGFLFGTAGMVTLGGSFAVSSLLVNYPFFASQALRYLLATVVLAAIVRYGRHGTVRPRPSDTGWLLAVALTGLVGFNLFLLAALRESEPAAVGTIVAGSPLLLASLGPAMQRQWPRRRLVFAAVAVALGAAVAQGGGSTSPAGVLFALLTLLCEAGFSLLAIPVLPRLGPIRLSTFVCGIATVLLGGISVVVEGVGARPIPSSAELLAIVYLALVLTVGAFIAWYTAVERLGVERAGLLVGLVPLGALIGGGVLGTGSVGVHGLMGSALVGTGVALGIGGGSSRSDDQMPATDSLVSSTPTSAPSPSMRPECSA